MIGILLKFLTGGLLDHIAGLGKLVLERKITEAQFRAEVEKAMIEAAAQMAESTQATIRSSPVLQRAVAFTLVSQVLVLLLYQIGPFLWPVLTGEAFPAPVMSIEWAYALAGGIAVSGGFLMRSAS